MASSTQECVEMVTPDPDGLRRTLDAALELFAERGYAGTSLLDVARRAGVSKSLIHYHFSSKSEMLRAVLAPYLDANDTVLEQLDAAADPDVATILDRYTDVVLAHPTAVRLVNTDVTSMADPVVEERVQTCRRRWRALLADDEFRATAALGVLTRPVTMLRDVDAADVRHRLVEVRPAALAALDA